MRKLVIALIGCGLCVATLARGQQAPVERWSVPLSDPSRPGRLKVSLLRGGVTVKGYDGKEIVVEAHMPGGTPENGKAGANRTGIPGHPQLGTRALQVQEQDNLVTVKPGATGSVADVVVHLPRPCSLELNCAADGDIRVEGVEGEIEANGLQGSITLVATSGAVMAHSLNGSIVAQIAKAAPDKAFSFSTLNGGIDVTLPPDTKASVKLQTENGIIHSDFQMDSRENAPPPGPRRVAGTINGGGAAVEIKTLNGSIRLRRAAKP